MCVYFFLYRNIFEKLTLLSEKYGEIFALQLGSIETVVLNSSRLMKQALIEKGSDFGNRPDFIRYSKLFGNDRDNCKFIDGGLYPQFENWLWLFPNFIRFLLN